MADPTTKWSENVDGSFYVDEQCIDCGVCVEVAPENFGRNEDDGHTFVKKQPVGDAELEACREAMEECPVESIGDDG